MPDATPREFPAHFFISYTSSDARWAEWVAWQLEEGGYRTVLQAWDFVPGSNFVLDMQAAAAGAERTIIVLSPQYLESAYAQSEWAAAFAGDPDGRARKLLPLRVVPCQPDGILAQVVYIDLVGLHEHAARARLLDRLGGKRGKPLSAPGFPGESRPPHGPAPFPGLVAHIPESPGAWAHRRRFVHATVTAQGLLDLAPALNPYAAFRDATDSANEEKSGSRIFAFLWFPTSQYIRSSALQPFTPAAAICVTDPATAARRLKCALGPLASVAVMPPSRMRNEEKTGALVAIADALQDSFVAAVTFPELVMGAGRHRPAVAYQAMVDLFLLPLVESHRRLEFLQFHARLSSVGEATGALIASAKKALKGGYAKRGSSSVELVDDGQGDLALLVFAGRMIAWAVGAFYNSANDKWVRLLEERMSPADT